MSLFENIRLREILDSRAIPPFEVDVILADAAPVLCFLNNY
jgi:enolase